MAQLIRERDGEGHYGSRVESFDPEQGMKLVGDKPMVGCALKVGTVTAGMFSTRDWWLTTPITEIVSENDKEVIFKTKNSTYRFVK